MRRRGLLALAVPAVLAAILAVQAYLVAGREYLPGDPGYTVRATVRPPGASGQPLRLVVLGDSTVAGVGSPSEEESLPVQIAERVARRLGRPVRVVGHGRSGARTLDVLAEQLPLVEDADALVIVVGSNDVTHLTPPWRLARRTRELLRAAVDRVDGPVVLGGIPLFRVAAFPQPLRGALDVVAAVQRKVQREAAADVAGARYVPIATLASPRFAGVPDALSSDGFHPGPIGYGFWADALAPAVADAVSRRIDSAASRSDGKSISIQP